MAQPDRSEWNDDYVVPEGDGVPPPPVGEDGEIDWDAYYSDPRFWAAVSNGERAKAKPAPPLPLARRAGANGSVMAAMMLGLREVFEPNKDRGEIIQIRDDSGDPDHPNKPFHLDFDPEDPENTRAIVRPGASGERPVDADDLHEFDDEDVVVEAPD